MENREIMTKGIRLKKQSRVMKFFLTSFLLIGTFNLWTYYDPISAWKIIGSWNTIAIINNFSGLFYAFAIIVTLVRIWKNNNSQGDEKTLWTVLSVFLPIIFGTYYIWFKEDEFSGRPN
jgi:hypothetical protein